MPSEDLRELYHRYGCCMAFVAVETLHGPSIGAAFHIGEGVFVTARHVVDATEIKEVRVTDEDLLRRSSLYPRDERGTVDEARSPPRICLDAGGRLALVEGPYFHPDDRIDVAAFRASGVVKEAHFVPLGSHLDDWVGKGDFELSRALVLGYPPVPLTLEPMLISVSSEVNGVVDVVIDGRRQMHLILSALPRGGFSGGLVMSEWGFALGVVTRSLLRNNMPEELGFFAVASVEPIYVCLSHNKILPACQKEAWGDFWDDY